MAAEEPRDQRFITLLRQSSTLPFARLPHTAANDRNFNKNTSGTVYAVLQPIDRMNTHVLNDLEQSHRDRFLWQAKQRINHTNKKHAAAGLGHPGHGIKRPHPGGAAEGSMKNGLPARDPSDSLAQLPEPQV